jgi:hypothetical protein
MGIFGQSHGTQGSKHGWSSKLSNGRANTHPLEHGGHSGQWDKGVTPGLHCPHTIYSSLLSHPRIMEHISQAQIVSIVDDTQLACIAIGHRIVLFGVLWALEK